MVILISAAETSSDAHGAELLKAMKKQLPPEQVLDAFGIGGPKLQSAGLRIVVDARKLLSMGFIEIFERLPSIFRALRTVTRAAAVHRPDVAIFIDYPDFHFLLARRLKKLGIPLIYYIPPKVWAWRKRRIHFLRKYFDKILCIFPFEETFYREQQVAVKYVGNPLVDELPLDLTQAQAREKLSLKKEDRVVVLMPGSRSSELKKHLGLMIRAAFLIAEALKKNGFLGSDQKLKVLLPFPATFNRHAFQTELDPVLKSTESLLDILISQGNSAECLVAADGGLIKSGTSTLEAGVLKCPHVVAYKPGRTTAWIFKNLIRYRGPIGLVNLVAGWKPGDEYLAPEFLCEKVTEEALANALVPYLMDTEKRAKMLNGLASLREKVCGKEERISPSVYAAREVIQLIRKNHLQSDRDLPFESLQKPLENR